MSNYYRETKHPTTGKWEKAEWADNHFAHHHYGVRFPSEPDTFYDPELVHLETRDHTGLPNEFQPQLDKYEVKSLDKDNPYYSAEIRIFADKPYEVHGKDQSIIAMELSNMMGAEYKKGYEDAKRDIAEKIIKNLTG